ncbi:MAG: hypothetical protein LBS12_02000 [Prevotellaceae bacterium]|jgi:hypothetical protein|nr:hypothetical protein [Prevotellaceae bacterium]
MIELIKRNSFVASSFYLVVLLALWLLGRLFLPDAAADGFAGGAIAPSSVWIGRLFEPAVSAWLACALTFVAALLLTTLNYRHVFYPTGGYLLPLLYILTAAAIPSTQWFSGAQVAATGALIGLHRLFASYKKSSGLEDLFIAAFCFSLSAICFPPALLLLLLLPAAIFLLRPATWRDWVAVFVGGALPFAFLLLFYWLSLHDIATAAGNLYALLPSLPVARPVFDLPVLIFWGVLVVTLFLSLASKAPSSAGARTKTVYIRIIFCLMLLLLSVGVILYPAYGCAPMSLCAIPVAAITAGYFASARNRHIKRLCGLLWLAAIVYLMINN